MSSSQEEEKKFLTLGTEDKVEIVVEESAAVLSRTIRNLVEDNCASTVIPVQVDSITMSKVIEYCSKHVGEETADEDKKKELQQFDADFAKELDTDMLYYLLLASNYLEIAGLLDLIAQQVADRIKGKSPEKIREMLNIKNDFTPDEDQKFRIDYPWAFD